MFKASAEPFAVDVHVAGVCVGFAKWATSCRKALAYAIMETQTETEVVSVAHHFLARTTLNRKQCPVCINATVAPSLTFNHL